MFRIEDPQPGPSQTQVARALHIGGPDRVTRVERASGRAQPRSSSHVDEPVTFAAHNVPLAYLYGWSQPHHLFRAPGEHWRVSGRRSLRGPIVANTERRRNMVFPIAMRSRLSRAWSACLLGLLFCAAWFGASITGAAAQATEVSEPGLVVEIFGREGCPHCALAETYLGELQRARPGLRVRHYDVVKDQAALEQLRAYTEDAGLAQAAVPALYVRGRLFVGFDGAETTGRSIEAWIDGPSESMTTTAAPTCHPSSAEPCADERTTARDRMRVPWLGELDVRKLGLPLFTVTVGLIDGFNPCAMWVLLFLLSMLMHLKNRARMALIAGTFVVVSGVAYFAFMAAWLNFFLLVGFSRTIQLVLGAIAIAVGSVHIKDFFAFGRGISFSIPDAAKPAIYRRMRDVLHAEHLAGALVSIVILAAMVNVVELVCTAGLPALYTQVLTAQGIRGAGYYAYLALYNVAYMLDDSVMLVIALVTLSQRKLQERGGRVLKLVSGSVMLALGLLLILKPEWLSWG